LAEVAAQVRAARHPQAPDWGRHDLSGRDLRHTLVPGTGLRGTLLIGADLRGLDLGGTDLLGADLRDCRVAGTGLAGCLFLTQRQLNSAAGDQHTTVPADLTRPRHWSSRGAWPTEE
jgi:uncharacterized protein YjbI with pentapeptide repeats